MTAMSLNDRNEPQWASMTSMSLNEPQLSLIHAINLERFHIFLVAYFQISKLEGQVKCRSKSFELFQLNRLIAITQISPGFKNGYSGKA